MSKRVIEVTFITKPGCHLCDDARPVLEDALSELRAEGIEAQLTELNMLDDETLISRYQEDIPVVLIDGKRHSYWRVDRERFIAAVTKRAARGLRGLFRS
ncbi:glutaredoxin family protein [Leucobacter chinensis]|uniref:glutaredoxin family protein n=1 Tax=Leucobacter chinensis TaxID=2851010 RepID=UPI001C24DF8A